MKPVYFKGYNVVFAKDQPEYQPLPAHRSDAVDRAVTSCWQLSWRERLRVLFTGRFYFSQLTFGTPLQPQMPSVEPPPQVLEHASSPDALAIPE